MTKVLRFLLKFTIALICLAESEVYVGVQTPHSVNIHYGERSHRFAGHIVRDNRWIASSIKAQPWRNVTISITAPDLLFLIDRLAELQSARPPKTKFVLVLHLADF